MNEGIKKFRELMLTDEAFRQELKAAGEAYQGEQSEEAVFSNVLLPLGQKYGVSVTFEEFKEYIDRFSDQEMDQEELTQISGGTKGFGATACMGIGIGGGGHGQDGRINATCVVIGFGDEAGACAGKGQLS